MSKKKKFDLILLLIWPILAVFISYLFTINLFHSLFVFLGFPSLFLTIRLGKNFAKKAAIFSLVFIPIAIVFEYIGHFTGQWLLLDSVLPKFFKYVSVETLVWLFFNLYFIVMFYEYFLHEYFTNKLWYPKIKYLLIFSLIVFVVFLFFYRLNPNIFFISYFYLRFTIFFALFPIIFQLFKYPKFISKFFETAAYFFYLTLTYEITALQLGWWAFPSEQFIGWVSIFNVRFPFEELFFWMMLCAMAVLSYYEFFDADEK